MLRTLWLAAVFAAAVSTATAQSIQLAPLQNTQAPLDNPEGTVVWLPSYDFHLNMAHLSSDSPRYNWDANYGGELGIVAVGHTQLTFVANYQAVLGDEFRTTELHKDAPSVQARADEWRTALLERGWRVP